MAHLDLNDLKARSLDQLIELAQQRRIDHAASLGHQDLLSALLRAELDARRDVSGTGVLEVLPDGFGFLRDVAASFQSGAHDIYVSPSQIRRFNLRNGDEVSGLVRAPKDNERYYALVKVNTVNGSEPDTARDTPAFESLTPVLPERTWTLEHGPQDPACRLVDLLAPLGVGQRALLVAPPRCSRRRLLRDLVTGLSTNHPEAEVLVALLAERPEELTEFQRTSSAAVVGSTFDEAPSRHLQVAEMVLARAQRLVEHGRDVILVVDSLSRLARAGNQAEPSQAATAALMLPKRLFGAARRTEEAGSLTVLATCLDSTGSRLDQHLLEELADTANWEAWLSPELAARGIYPPLDPSRTANLRLDRVAPGAEDSARKARDAGCAQGLDWLLRQLDQHPTNAEVSSTLAA
jgi:transcription termination factor Rho